MVALRGTSSVDDVITDSVADPRPVAAWVPAAFAKQHARSLSAFHAHAGILGAAEAVLQVLSCILPAPWLRGKCTQQQSGLMSVGRGGSH